MSETWEWVNEKPTRDEVVEKLESLPDVWLVRPVDFIDFVMPMTNRQKVEIDGREQYVPVTKLYMQVAGRIKMLESAQSKMDWTVIEHWDIVNTDPFVLRMGVEIRNAEDRLIGVRYGVAKAKGGDSAWEKMETAARGRALGAWGFGVLPGSGFASADEMELVGVELTEETQETRRKPKSEIIEEIRNLRVELAMARGQDIEDLDKGLAAYVKRRWGLDLEIGESGIDLQPMKDGQLVLMHNDLVQQLKKLRADDQRMI